MARTDKITVQGLKISMRKIVETQEKRLQSFFQMKKLLYP